MFFVLRDELAGDYLERAADSRGAHLGLATAARERGELVMAGALADPADEAILVFQGDNASVAEDFAGNDPYVSNGLVTSWTVRPWTVVIGPGVDPPTA